MLNILFSICRYNIKYRVAKIISHTMKIVLRYWVPISCDIILCLPTWFVLVYFIICYNVVYNWERWLVSKCNFNIRKNIFPSWDQVSDGRSSRKLIKSDQSFWGFIWNDLEPKLNEFSFSILLWSCNFGNEWTYVFLSNFRFLMLSYLLILSTLPFFKTQIPQPL